MPIPNVPQNFLAQPGNGQIYLSWTPSVGTTAYTIQRSADGVNYSDLVSTSSSEYYDSSPTTGILWRYQVTAATSAGVSNPSDYSAAVLCQPGQISLYGARLAAQQRADMVNNDFVTTQEWNTFISKSYQELYDLLVQVYGDEYYAARPISFTLDGRYPALYPLPNDFYKLLGADLAVGATQAGGWLTLRKFAFISRNQYIYGNSPANAYGVLQLRYRLQGNNIIFAPTPQTNQQIQLWYIPRPATLVADYQILDGISGWDDYVVVDAAIKAKDKEESDVTVLMAQKEALKRRIEAAASNRDAGESECATDVRRLDGGYWGDGPGGSPSGGF